MQLLGLKPEEVTQTVGMSLVAPDQTTQQRIQEAFADIQQGKPRTLPELELRRKDNGKPVWVQFWSRPEPDGKLTRTMILDITERVLAQREQARLIQHTAYLQEEIKQSSNFEEIIGRSTGLAKVLEHVRAVAPTDASVLIHGETGTGKELIARAVHAFSKRCDRPLIKVNCAALPAGLIESELFGHEKGAFTGAVVKRTISRYWQVIFSRVLPARRESVFRAFILRRWIDWLPMRGQATSESSKMSWSDRSYCPLRTG